MSVLVDLIAVKFFGFAKIMLNVTGIRYSLNLPRSFIFFLLQNNTKVGQLIRFSLMPIKQRTFALFKRELCFGFWPYNLLFFYPLFLYVSLYRSHSANFSAPSLKLSIGVCVYLYVSKFMPNFHFGVPKRDRKFFQC